jgi:uncharacterized tellurite resistance protein B-like protein
MLRALTAFFDQAFGSGGEAGGVSREHQLRLATAVLLIEVARADFAEDDIEIDVVAELLESHLGMSGEEIVGLVDEAQRHADHSASLQSFTRHLHEELDVDEKLKIIEMLWRVALADQTLDKHEDHLIRKVAGLMYISHSDLIRIRNRVRNQATDRSH